MYPKQGVETFHIQNYYQITEGEFEIEVGQL